MHAVLITYRPGVTDIQLMEAIAQRVDQSTRLAHGLVMKTAVQASAEQQSDFYLFSNREAVMTYLSGDFFHWFATCGLISELSFEIFSMEEASSALFDATKIWPDPWDQMRGLARR